MGGRKSKLSESSTPFPNNLYQNQNQYYGNQAENDYMKYNQNHNHTNHNHHHTNYNHHRHNHGHHNHWNHKMHNHNHNRHHHHNHNQHETNFNQNSFNPNDGMNSLYPNANDGYNGHGSFPPEDYPQDPFQHPDPRLLEHEGPRPIMNPNIDRMNYYRRMRRRPRRRLRRRRAFDPFVDGEFLAENNPEFFVDPHQPRYLTNRDVKFMKNTYWNQEDERTSSSQSAKNTMSTERNFSHSEQSEQFDNSNSNQSNDQKSPLEKIKPPKLRKLRLKPFKPVDIPDIKFEHNDQPELTSRIINKNNVLARHNKKKYPTTFYAKPVRPKKVADEFHFKVFNRNNEFNTAKYLLTSIRVPKDVKNELTIKVEQ